MADVCHHSEPAAAAADRRRLRSAASWPRGRSCCSEWRSTSSFVAPIRQVDLDVFLRAGQAVLHGHDPYSSTHSETIRTNAAFVYPLAVAWWFAPLSAIGASHLLYAIASLLAIGLACWWARPGQPLIAALVLLSSAAVIGLQDGSVNPWLLLGLIAAWRWRDRPIVTGLVVAALIICKLFLWPVLGWLLLSRRYRAAGTATVVTGVVLVAGFTFGPLGSSAYASMLHVLSGLEAPHAAGLSGLLIHWHASLALATVIATGDRDAAAGGGRLPVPPPPGRKRPGGARLRRRGGRRALRVADRLAPLLPAARRSAAARNPFGLAVRRAQPRQLGGRCAALRPPRCTPPSATSSASEASP